MNSSEKLSKHLDEIYNNKSFDIIKIKNLEKFILYEFQKKDKEIENLLIERQQILRDYLSLVRSKPWRIYKKLQSIKRKLISKDGFIDKSIRNIIINSILFYRGLKIIYFRILTIGVLNKILLHLNLNFNAKEIKKRINKNQSLQIQFYKNLYSLRDVHKKKDNQKIRILDVNQLPELLIIKKRNILFITSLFPRKNHGGGIRIFNFIRILSESNNIYLVTPYDHSEDLDSYNEFSKYCRSILKIDKDNFGNNQIEIDNWLGDVKVDIVHYEWPYSIWNYSNEYAPIQIFTYMESVSLRLLIDLNIIDTTSDLWLEKFCEFLNYLSIEIVGTKSMDMRIAVTDKDALFFQKIYPYIEYCAINHGITLDDIVDNQINIPEENSILFVGNFAHYPNVDAIIFFIENSWNKILSVIPHTKFYIVGANPEKIERYKLVKNVIIIGQVEDVKPYISNTSVCIAPLVSGAGLRGKVIEYAAMRKPFVATSIAVSGLKFINNEHFLLADSGDSFADSIINLLKDKSLYDRLSISAYKIVKENYDTRNLVKQLEKLYAYIENKKNIQ